MSTLTLRHPIHTLDNQLLFPKGALLSAEALDGLISLNKYSSQQGNYITQHGSIRKESLHFLSNPPYNIIFTDLRKIANFLNLIDSVRLAPPFLESLDYFKRYDFYTYRHVLLVFALSSLLAQYLIPDYKSRVLEAATGPTHDIGKICVPLHVLKKSTPLTRTEWGMLEHHAVAGYVLLSYYLKDIRNIATIVARDHHERKDGSGYPSGIHQTDSMVEIITVSDIYDALISKRPYRPVSYDNRTALEEITSMAEKNKIGWGAVKALVALNRRDKPHYSDIRVSKEKRGTSPQNNLYGIIADKKSPSQQH